MKKRYSALFFVALGSIFFIELFAQNNVNLQESYQLNISRTTESIIIDGALDEQVWKTSGVATDFWVSYPTDGIRASPEVKTIVRVTYDDEFIYVAAECIGPGPYIIQSLKRDNPLFWRGDAFGLVFDPVNERTNGFVFAVNPEAVQSESLITGQTGRRGNNQSAGGFNGAWDNKWYSEVQILDDKWTVEMAIPFKSLRFGDKREWGVNFLRGDAKNNSYHAWSPVPVQFRGVDLGYTGKMIWDEAPGKTKKNISVIPYLLGIREKNFEQNTPLEQGQRVGLDAKVAVTSSLNLDLTINPDFSQVDVDEQQTNLTTVNLRFPERRLFFLENSDVFNDFGIPPMRPFFSRKIGLDEEGNTIPILYGARLSGNLNKNLRMSLMNTQTKSEELPGNNYTSFAVRQRIFQRSIIKGYFHNRQMMTQTPLLRDDYNTVGGLEFGYRSQNGKWQGSGGYGMAFTEDQNDQNHFYSATAGFDGKAFNFYANASGMGDDYQNDFGFIPRKNHYDALEDTTYVIGFDHVYSRVGYTFYPDNTSINQHGIRFSFVGDWTATSNELIAKTFDLNYNFSFINSSTLQLTFKHEDVNLLYPFGFTEDNDPLPSGLYHFDYGEIKYQSDNRRVVNIRSGFRYGGFYNGTRLETSLAANYRAQPWGNFSVNFIYNDLRFPGIYGRQPLFLLGPKAEVSFSRNLFWTTFFQYNTQRDNFNINSRIQWRYLPMSDLFIVYSDNYMVENFGPRNRTLVLKLNYWLNL